MVNPCPGYSITTPYGKKGSAWGAGWHDGADWAAPAGTDVVAPWGGTVVEAAYPTSFGSAFGRAVVIDHDKLPDGSPGLWGLFAHLSAEYVSVGQRVEAGQKIGDVGTTGNSTGNHLHFGVYAQPSWCSGCGKDPQPWIEADMGNAYDYDYSGKPGGTLHVGRDYVNLDIEEWDPPNKGLEHVLTYLNCSGFVFDGNAPGRIRVCLERNPDNSDRTGYCDYTVVPGQSELLITHVYFEQGDGTRTWSQIKCMDGLRSMVVGTRYQKRAVIR